MLLALHEVTGTPAQQKNLQANSLEVLSSQAF